MPEGADERPVREFSTFTDDLERLAEWLTSCGVTTVAMESTGIYWIPVFEFLARHGLEVKLVNARHIKNVPGRNSDVLDCQGLQQLHTSGLLRGALRPADQVCTLRAYGRHLMRSASSSIQRMQKALAQMNLQLHNVVTDITGVTGMGIIKALLAGERNPQKLAALQDKRGKNSQETIARTCTAITGQSLCSACNRPWNCMRFTNKRSAIVISGSGRSSTSLTPLTARIRRASPLAAWKTPCRGWRGAICPAWTASAPTRPLKSSPRSGST